MGHAIPKIHYSVTTTTGDTTNTVTTLSNMADTAEIEVGMYAVGAGVPAGATVISKTATTVVISAAATITAATVALEFYFKIEFDYPPVEETGEKLLPQERRNTSLSGVSQVSVDYIEGVRSLDFRFLSNALYVLLKAFYDTSAVYGESFRYFEDKTLSSYVTYELKTYDWNPQKISSRGVLYVWGVPLQFRRAV